MEKIQEKLKQSLPLLKEASKFSASSVFKVTKTLIFFIVFNLIFLITGLIYLFVGDIIAYKIVLVILILIVGIVSTFLATTKRYHQVLLEAGKIYFDKLETFKLKFAESVIDKLEAGAKTKAGMTVNQIVNIPQIINSSYENVPKIIVKGINYLVSKIPLVEYIDVINKEFISQDKEQKVNYLVGKTNAFFNEKVFSINHVKTIRIIFVVAILLQIAFVYFIKN